MGDTKIIILTPVKNEEWILEQFLSSVSLFADCIIVADQFSTDQSREICRKFDKVTLIDNKSEKYDEASRQHLLIEAARQQFPEARRIFFCLDADELFSADSLTYTETWDKIKALPQGTSIYIEKPDVLYGIKRSVRWKDNYFAIGYVDDGLTHKATTIHSKRIPENPAGDNVYIDNIKILHFAHSRRNVQSAKLRYYSVIENINQSKPFYLRRFAYPCFYDEKKNYPAESIEPMPDKWLARYDELGINLRQLPDPEFSWHDFEILRFFKKYGYSKFYLENIWDFDWEKARQYALASNVENIPQSKINTPGFLWQLLGNITDLLYSLYRKVKN